jgi:integrase
MGARGLTDAGIRAITPPLSGRIDVPDPACSGLYLRVSSTGARSWSLKFRDRVTGKTERRTIGRYPETTLAKARAIADRDRVAIREGENPQERLRQARRSDKAAPTFDELADRYFAEFASAQKKASTVAYERAILSSARSVWGSRKARTITRQEIRDFLDARAARAPIAANRTVAVMSGLFGWAVEKGLIEATPVQKIARPTKRERPKDRVLSEVEIQVLWPLFDQLDPAMAAAFRLLLLTGQRPGQVVAMERAELRQTTSGIIWEIPLDRRKDTRGTKRGPHLVPLPPAAAEIVQEPADQGEELSNQYVFRSRKSPGSAIERHSLSRALQRVINRLPAGHSAVFEQLKSDRPTPHDFRRTVATQLAALGVPREDRLAVLDHSEGDVHDLHYDRHDRLREKREALELWALRLGVIISEAGDLWKASSR